MGQVLFQLVAQAVDVYLLFGGKVRAKVVLTVQLADNHSDLLDIRLRRYKPLDLAQLDAQAAQLDLIVKSAEDDDVEVLVVLCVVAGAVHPLIAVCNKRLSGFFGQVAVT